MKNKLVINIIIAYFVVLCVVLVIQLNDSDSEIVTQVHTVEADSSKVDKMANSVVIKIGNSSVLINESLFSIDEKDDTIVPKIIDGTAFVPAKLFSSAFKGNISWDADSRELVIRYNNKAVVLRENENKMRVVDNIDEEEKEIEKSFRIIDGCSYVPLKIVSEAFDKNVFFDKGVIIISNLDITFDKDDESSLIDDIIQKFKVRNVFVFENNNCFAYSDEKVIRIDENNEKIVPLIENGRVYIPVKSISSVFGGESVWNGDIKELTLSYNNREAIFTGLSDKVSIVKGDKKTDILLKDSFKIINEYSYVALDAFAEIFEKNIFIDGNFIIVSGRDNVFQKETDGEIIEKLEKNITKVSE